MRYRESSDSGSPPLRMASSASIAWGKVSHCNGWRIGAHCLRPSGSYTFPQAIQTPFYQTLYSWESGPISRERESYFQEMPLSWRVFLCTLYTETPERTLQEPSGNETGFLEARSGFYVFRVPSVALQEDRFCAPCTRKNPERAF